MFDSAHYVQDAQFFGYRTGFPQGLSFCMPFLVSSCDVFASQELVRNS
jgi:hypothetical protein